MAYQQNSEIDSIFLFQGADLIARTKVHQVEDVIKVALSGSSTSCKYEIGITSIVTLYRCLRIAPKWTINNFEM